MRTVIRRVEYDVEGKDGRRYWPRVVGEPDGHLWQGDIEFVPVREGETVISTRETSQGKVADLEYWASGLEATYFEGALARALRAANADERVVVPDVIESDALARLVNRAELLRRAGDLAGAINAARRVLGTAPGDADALYILAVAHAERGDRTAAKSCVTDFLTVAPEDDPRRREAEKLLADVDEAIARAAGM